MTAGVNVARRLDEFAASRPHAVAVAAAKPSPRRGEPRYDTITFAQLAADSDRIARGLRAWGVEPGARLALLVKPGVEFVTLVFALLKAGVVQILIDPGMGRKNLLQCLEDAKPEGFVAIPMVQAIRRLLRRRYPAAKWNVTVGRRRWFWDGLTLDQIREGEAPAEPFAETAARQEPRPPACASMRADDPAAVIFTTGSTGPPKGVLYSHGNFDRQVDEIRDRYGIAPGEVNLACFPLFGLFNAAMGVTTVFPQMDFSRPAQVDPRNIVRAVEDWSATQSFASPAVWEKVGYHCLVTQTRLPTLREAYSAGAPVPPKILQHLVGGPVEKIVHDNTVVKRVGSIELKLTESVCILDGRLADGARMHTPYGATEALPIASIEAREVLLETRHAWAAGKGTCVGTRFPGIEWKVVKIVDGPICTIDRAQELPRGEIGELIVRGPVVTSRYVTRVEANATAKIHDGAGYWHRMGDAGYLDDRDRFWFCGRTAHRVQTESGTLYTDPVEGVFNQHRDLHRSALVGVGPVGKQQPVVIVEPHRGLATQQSQLFEELRELALKHDVTRDIDTFLIHPSFPVDIRHNSKIFREQLAVWAAKVLKSQI